MAKTPKRSDREKIIVAAQNRNGAEMKRILLQARDRIELKIVEAAKKGNIASAAYLRDTLYKSLREEYQNLQGNMDEWATKSVTDVAKEWTRLAVEDLPNASYSEMWASFSEKHLQERIAQFAPTSIMDKVAVNAGQLDPILGGMLKQDIQSLRKIVIETSRMQAATGMTASEWRKEVQDQLFQRRGAWTFIDKAGREWESKNYFNMLNKTLAANTARETYMTQMVDSGNDLATVEGGFQANTDDVCAKWNGQIVSISGTSREYPALADAVEEGLFHPNCIHYLAVFNKGEEAEAAARDKAQREFADRQAA